MKKSQRKRIKKRKEWRKMRNIIKNNFSKVPPIRKPRLETVEEDHDITSI